MKTNLSMYQESSSPCDGIGIIQFLQGKHFFITGATGFLGKALIEKMLRAIPDVGKMYVLIRGKDKEAVMKRVKSEIMDAELFKLIKEIHGESYKSFMMSKLVPVRGDICEFNLGMDSDIIDEIAKEIDVIINSAANTSWDTSYDVALDTNTKGPARVLDFAKKCKKLKIFLHVSTAYVNGRKEGIFLEKPFCMEQRLASETMTSEHQAISVPCLDINAEFNLAAFAATSIHRNIEGNQMMRALGMERARIYGWWSTYEMTKAMGEMLIDCMRSTIPTIIIRPSMIESTYKEPFPGWIQGYKVPIASGYGHGQLQGFVGDPNTIVDVVPLDMVVNATLAAIAKHGIAKKPELQVYHIATSVANPLTFGDSFSYYYDHFTSSPLLDSKWKKIIITPFKFFDSMDSLSDYLKNEIARQSGLTADRKVSMDPKLLLQTQMACIKRVQRFLRVAELYKPYMFYKGRFDIKNTKKLIEEMSIDEMTKFNFDMESINWKHYTENVHIPGIRRHLLKKPAAAKL